MLLDFPGFARWSDDDVERLLKLIEGGNSTPEIARVLGRSETDLEQEAHFLGVQLPRHHAVHVLTCTADSSAISATIHYAPFHPQHPSM